MFDIGWPELLVIMVVALVVIGPKDLPRVLQTVGKWVRKARSLAREFQSSVDDMVREAELDDLRKQVQQAKSLNLKDQVQKAVDPKGELTESLSFGDLDLDDGEDEGSRPPPKPAEAKPAAVEHKPAAEMPLGTPPTPEQVASSRPAPTPASTPADLPAAEKRG